MRDAPRRVPEVLALVTFDAVDLDRLRGLLDEGRLPNLAGLRERGTWTALDTPATHFVAAAYPTLFSGRPVGDHGLYYPFQWSPWHQRVVLASDLPAPEYVWERLARTGARSLVIDPYEAVQPRSDVGLAVSGWQFRNRVVLRDWSSPSTDRRALERRHGASPILDEVFGRPSVPGLLSMRSTLLAGPSRVADLVVETLAREQFDLLWATFSTPHLAGHWLWSLSTIGDEAGTKEQRTALRTGLDTVYEQTDRALGRILSALPPGTDVIVLSPSGMGPQSSFTDILPDMLAAVLAGGRVHEAGDSAGGAMWRLRASVPLQARARLARALPAPVALDIACRMETRGVDWSQTRALALPGDHNGHIRLNIRGREREGVVDPSEADALMAQIAEGLMSFRTPEGSPAIASVDRASDLAPGVALDRLPDLVVRWTPTESTRVGALLSDRFGQATRRGVGSGRSGNHTDDAWALIVPAASQPAELDRGPHVMDIAATACELLAPGQHSLPGQSLLRAA